MAIENSIYAGVMHQFSFISSIYSIRLGRASGPDPYTHGEAKKGSLPNRISNYFTVNAVFVIISSVELPFAYTIYGKSPVVES